MSIIFLNSLKFCNVNCFSNYYNVWSTLLISLLLFFCEFVSVSTLLKVVKLEFKILEPNPNIDPFNKKFQKYVIYSS